MDYGIKLWGDNNFFIDNKKVKLNYKSSPSLVKIVQQIRENDIKGPILLRFPHLIEKQIDLVYRTFNKARAEFKYRGTFNAVYPLKVNQYPNFVKNLVQLGEKYDYGLEAGSKAELFLAMAYNNKKAPITVNGFKDEEMISIGFIACEMGHNITITIEGLSELENIIKISKKRFGSIPNIGLRIRLHSSGVGIWAKSGGINSKFGLTSTELLQAVNLLKKANLIEKFTMIHFHIGSQISEIGPLKKALREAGNLFVQLKKMGATGLNAINIGGGLAIEYSQHRQSMNRNYSLSEYANDITFLLKDISVRKNVPEPNIFIESGRYIAASHAVLVAPVLELFSQEYTEEKLQLKEKNPPLVQELYDIYKTIDSPRAQEYLHDSLDHMDSLLTLFDLGYIDLIDRSNTEILVNLIMKKAIMLLKDKKTRELLRIQDMVQERYLVNFSMFQSLPDLWGISQSFPVMPLDRLDEKPTRSASIWDITCDSDGEISYNRASPLILHDVDVTKEEYFIGFFLVGAYQEVLGMDHNLFTHPTEATIRIDDTGFSVENVIESQSILDIFEDLDYDIKEVQEILNEKIEKSSLIDDKTKKYILGEIYLFLNDNGYLKTINGKDDS
ncbi:biosynthetic arginine decarboxylase [Sulfurospirillum sp. 1612]|uniref:biosynthetic arginine decarboxylase n=1 Tax=Sulfurospirillum sp. 1612 TaxID=3094835 RepID=UPI002F925F7D